MSHRFVLSAGGPAHWLAVVPWLPQGTATLRFLLTNWP
jgi:hypothetical protein